jgi:hypothetical protein
VETALRIHLFITCSSTQSQLDMSNGFNVLCAAEALDSAAPLLPHHFTECLQVLGIANCRTSQIMQLSEAIVFQFFIFADAGAASSAIMLINGWFASHRKGARAWYGYPYPELHGSRFQVVDELVPGADNADGKTVYLLCGHFPACNHDATVGQYRHHLSKVCEADIHNESWSDLWGTPPFAAWALRYFQPDRTPRMKSGHTNGLLQLTEHVTSCVIAQSRAGGPKSALFTLIEKAILNRDTFYQVARDYFNAVPNAGTPVGGERCPFCS